MCDRFNRALSIVILTIIMMATVVYGQPQTPPMPEHGGKINLGPAINSGAIEILPVVSPDGGTIYFDRKYSRGNVGGPDDEDDIYYSTIGPNGAWLPAKNIGPPLNTTGSDVLFWISADGNTALVHNGGKVKGKTIGLAISRRTGNVWGTPKPISIAGLGNLSDISEGYHANISPDGSRLLLAFGRDRANPEDLDIYFCPALGTDYMRWGAPVPLGDSVNTPAPEWAPWIASDNRTLYFASGGHGGYGATDLLLCRRLDDTWRNWSAPVNLGPIINTPGSEASISVSADGNYAYMSGIGLMGDVTYGQADIYRMKLDDSLRPQQHRVLAGELMAASRGVRGLVRVERLPGRDLVGSTTSDARGAFRFELPSGGEYRITGWAQGYPETSVTADMRSGDGAMKVTLVLDRGSAPSDTSTVRRAPTVVTGSPALFREQIDGFAVGSADLPKSAVAKLQKLLAPIREALAKGDGTVDVIGYTDDTGENDSNSVLSVARAYSVIRWFQENGVRGRISSNGRGEASPVASNDTPEGRARNRRVEILVMARP